MNVDLYDLLKIAADKLMEQNAELKSDLATAKAQLDEARQALRQIWQSGDAFLPYIDEETTNRWRRAAGWEETK